MTWKKLARWSGMIIVFIIMGTIDNMAMYNLVSNSTTTATEIITAAKELGGKWVIIAMVIVTFYYKLESEKEVK